MKYHLLTLVVLCFCCLQAQAENSIRFYVSPDGSDTNDGSQNFPFLTIQKAQEAVRGTNSRMKSDIIVNLLQGDYQITQPLQFAANDSGFNGHSIIYRSTDGIGKARIRGSFQVTNWKPSGKKNVWQAHLGDIDEFHTIYADGSRLHKARFPNRIASERFPTALAPYLNSTSGSPALKENESTGWIRYADGEIDATDLKPETLRISIFPWAHADWHRFTFKVTAIDPTQKEIRFDTLNDKTQIGSGARYFLEDDPKFLDAHGEFFFDRQNAVLYLYWDKQSDPNETEIVIPVLKSLVRIEGESPEHTVQNLVFDGIRFEETDTVSPVLHYWSLGWGDQDDALLWIKNAENISILKCHLLNSGRHGIVMTGANRNNLIGSCLIEHIGVSGILLVATETKDGSRADAPISTSNHIDNTRIRGIGEMHLYAEGIGVFGSSNNEITNCDIYDSARYAISLRGRAAYNVENLHFRPNAYPARDNLFSHLRIFDCGQDSGDMGAVHAAVVNIPNGPDRNHFEQITIENIHAVEGMNDFPPDGIYLDWPNLTMHQSFRDIHIFDVGGLQLRPHGQGNLDSAVTENVSWEDNFDPTRIEYEAIGVRPDFPTEFGGRQSESSTPQAPTGLSAKALDESRIALSWNQVDDHPKRNTTYEIFRDGIRVGTTQNQQWVDAGLKENSSAEYTVRALWHLNHEGNHSPSIHARTLPDTEPPLPIGLRLSEDGRKISIAFSEAIDAASATNSHNYLVLPDRRTLNAEVSEISPYNIIIEIDPPISPEQPAVLLFGGIADTANVKNIFAAPPSLSNLRTEDFQENDFGATRRTFASAHLNPVPPPLMRYSMNDASESTNVTDSGTNGIPGEIIGEFAWQQGQSPDHSDALFFNGMGTYVKGPASVNLGGNDFTLSFWLKRDYQTAATVIGKGLGWNNPGEWNIVIGQNNISLRTQNKYYTSADDSVGTGRWHYFALVRKAGVLQWYVDGKPSGEPSQAFSHTDFSNNKPIVIGKRDYKASPNFFSGLISDLCIYNTALSPEEIEARFAIPAVK